LGRPKGDAPKDGAKGGEPGDPSREDVIKNVRWSGEGRTKFWGGPTWGGLKQGKIQQADSRQNL